jgi:hypothetical protein
MAHFRFSLIHTVSIWSCPKVTRHILTRPSDQQLNKSSLAPCNRSLTRVNVNASATNPRSQPPPLLKKTC